MLYGIKDTSQSLLMWETLLSFSDVVCLWSGGTARIDSSWFMSATMSMATAMEMSQALAIAGSSNAAGPSDVTGPSIDRSCH
jgi:hypothetical protein